MSMVAAELIARVTADTAPAERDLKQFGQRMGSMTGSVLAGNLLSGGISAVGRGLADLGRAGVGAFTDMIATGADFTAQMDGVAAVLGGTQEQAAALGQLAIDLAIDPNLKVNATEAAAAIQNLATAGLTAEQILGGATEATVLLANSTGGDFGQAATVATDVMALFGVEAENMMDAVDGIAAVSNVSKFDLNDYSLALSQAGGVAAISGVSFEDFNAVIAGTSSYFASGSDAGTSFKTFLQRLNPTTKEARDLMAELNLLSEDGTSVFYDQTGALKDMDEVVEIMNETFGEMTESQKSFYLGQLFGTDAMRTAAAVADMSSDSYNNLKDTMADTSALDAAKVRTDNFKSAWENLGGAIEATKIQMFAALEPAAQKLTEALSPIIDFAAPKLQQMAADLGTWLSEKIPAVEVAITTAYDESGGSLFAAAVAGIAELTGLTDELERFQAFWNTTWTALSAIVDAAWGAIEPYWQSMTTWLQTTLTSALSGLQSAFDAAWAAMPAIVETAVTGIQTAWDTLSTWFATDGVSVLSSLQTTFSTVWNAMPQIVDTARQGIQTAWALIEEYFGPSVERIKTAIGGLATGFAPVLEALPGLQEAFVRFGEAVTPVLQALGGGIGVVAILLSNTLAEAIEALAPIVTQVVEQVTLAIDSIATVLEGAVMLIQGIIDGDWTLAWQGAQDIVFGILTFIVGTIENLASVVAIVFGGIKDAIVNTLTDLGVDVDELLSGIKATWDEIWTSFNTAVGAVVEAVTGIKDAIQGFITWIGGISIPNPFAALEASMAAVAAGLPGATPAPAASGMHRELIPGTAGEWRLVPDNNATGNPLFGGGWTMVGERGAELVRLPRGSRIYDDAETSRMMGGTTIVNNYNTLAKPHDIELLAQRVAAQIGRRAR
jgi:TP901 family phage tail tape measure protein